MLIIGRGSSDGEYHCFVIIGQIWADSVRLVGFLGYGREVKVHFAVYPAILPLVKLYCRLSLFAWFREVIVVGL